MKHLRYTTRVTPVVCHEQKYNEYTTPLKSNELSEFDNKIAGYLPSINQTNINQTSWIGKATTQYLHIMKHMNHGRQYPIV